MRRIDPTALPTAREALFESMMTGRSMAERLGIEPGTFWRYFRDRSMPAELARRTAREMREWAEMLEAGALELLEAARAAEQDEAA